MPQLAPSQRSIGEPWLKASHKPPVASSGFTSQQNLVIFFANVAQGVGIQTKFGQARSPHQMRCVKRDSAACWKKDGPSAQAERA